jgi:hypothetical protein
VRKEGDSRRGQRERRVTCKLKRRESVRERMEFFQKGEKNKAGLSMAGSGKFRCGRSV